MNNPQITAVVRNVQKMQSEAMIRKRSLIKKATSQELKVKKILEILRVPFTFQKIIFTQNRYFIADFWIGAKRRIILEIDGDSHNRTKDSDTERTRLIQQQKRYSKYAVVRIQNKEVDNGEFINTLKKIFPVRFQRHGDQVNQQKSLTENRDERNHTGDS